MIEELVPAGGWADAADSTSTAEWVGTPTGGLWAISSLARRFGREEVPQVFTALHRNSRIFWPWLVFASRLLPGGRLPPRDRETIILRTAWNCRSRYEWAQHVAVALGAGLTDDAIVRIARGPSASEDPHERALLSMCDELAAEHRVSETTWAYLRERYPQPLQVELLVLAGQYQLLAGFLNTLGLPLEPQVVEVLDAFHGRIAGGRGIHAATA